jgi:hypothetical protein
MHVSSRFARLGTETPGERIKPRNRAALGLRDLSGQNLVVLRLEGLLELFKLPQTGKERLRHSLRSEENPLLLANETVDLCKVDLIARHRFAPYRTACCARRRNARSRPREFLPGRRVG